MSLPWERIIILGADTHIVPLEDYRPHDETSACWCRPESDDGIWIHHSLDRRELYEHGVLRLH